MKKRYIALITLCSLVVFGYVGAVVAYNSKPITQTVQQPPAHIYTTAELLAEANRLRAEKGVAPLVIDERLNQSAQWKADDMKAFDYFGHVRDGYNGAYKIYDLTRQPDGRSECLQASENLQWDGTESPFKWWVTSKPHYEALINPRYETTGFGYASVNGRNTYVQHFCDLR